MIALNLKIDPSFLREEERCGYLVTRQRKEVWAVELDLLAELDRVCRKHGLKYCVGAGTMLGAVRHQGFIPWDDDMDLYMLREDYDRLNVCAGEFRAPYFLQNSYTEKNLLRTFARLRNSNTTGTTRIDQALPVNKGIFIDIFPLDGISPDAEEDRRQDAKNKRFRAMFGPYNTTRKPAGKGLGQRVKWAAKKLYSTLFVRDPQKLFTRYEDNLRRFSKPDTALWGNRTLVFACPKSRRPVEDYRDLIDMPFEFITVPVPRAYDAMLRQQYGDYMKIPENKGGNMHGELIISTDYAYDDPRRTQKA